MKVITKKIVGVPEAEHNVCKQRPMKRKLCYESDSHNDTKHSTICDVCKNHVHKVNSTTKTICNTYNKSVEGRVNKNILIFPKKYSLV